MTTFEFFSLPFMQRALIAGLLMGLVGGYYGVFVVQRKLSFLGDGLAHAAFGGVALGMLLGHDPLTTALPFTVLVSLAITWVKNRTQLSSDTAIGIFFSVSAALGIVFLSLRHDYSVDAFSYLFGSILGVTAQDLRSALAVSVLALLSLVRWSKWTYATFDRDLARADGVQVERDDYLISALVAVTIVIAVKVVGIMLVAAYLVIPPAAARLVTSRFSRMTVVSAALGAASALLGLVSSYYADLPSGAMIILVQAAFFVCALGVSLLRRI